MFHLLSPLLYAFYVEKIQKIPPCPQNPLMRQSRKIHNLGLSILSLLMFIGVLVANIQTGKLSSIDAIICRSYQGNIVIHYTVWIFLYSKYWEWLDTLFLHLSGRPISQLQYTHHMSVPLVTYVNINGFVSPYALVLAGSNCLVHTVMYWYFAYPKGVLYPFRKMITVSQIVQHIMCLLSIGYSYFQDDCHKTPYAVEVSISAYLMYLIYFVIFYLKSYKKNGD